MRGYRLQRANRIARKLFRDPSFWASKDTEPRHRRKVLGMLRKTRKPCSCWMCGHRRQHDGLTIQELRQIE
jgi:hypothetical protein